MATYTKVFDNPYPSGWENLPSENTPITASALQEHTDAIENIEDYLEDNPIESGTTDYTDLSNKPQINGHTLSGNMTTSQIGITVPTQLSDLSDDSSHRVVTDTEKTTWNGKQNAITSTNKLSYSLISGTPTIPTQLSDLSDDATHRLVSDTEKSTWNGKNSVSWNQIQASGTKIAEITIDGTKTDVYSTSGGGGGGASSWSDLSDKPFDSVGSGLKVESDVLKADVVDNLTTQDSTKSLSANQGKVLNESIATKQNSTDNSLTTTSKTIVGAINEQKESLAQYEDNGFLSKNLLEVSATTQTIDGVTLTFNADKTITISGTATNDINFTLGVLNLDSNKTYKLLGCPLGGTNSTYCLYFGIVEEYGYGKTFTNKSSANPKIWIKNGVTCNNLVFKPMITTDLDATYSDYQPYVPSNNDLKQSLNNKEPLNASATFETTSLKFHIEKRTQTKEVTINVNLISVANGSNIANLDDIYKPSISTTFGGICKHENGSFGRCTMTVNPNGIVRIDAVDVDSPMSYATLGGTYISAN